MTAQAQPRPARVTKRRSPRSMSRPIDSRVMLTSWQHATRPEDYERLAEKLTVSVNSLRQLGAAWAAKYRAWAFPMADADGVILGIRLRAETGRKWAVRGSHQGLFLPEGGLGEQVNEVIVCEGPTDTAALLTLGLSAVGRPSCSGGGRLLLPLLAGRHVIILADRDAPKVRPDGTTWNPGWQGAQPTAEVVACAIRQMQFWRPTP